MTDGSLATDEIEPISSILELLRFHCEHCKYKAAKEGKARASESATIYTYFLKAGNKIKIGQVTDRDRCFITVTLS